MYGATQVLTDCPSCHVESALLELIDPSERIGVPIEGRCRLCGYATELGEVVAFGQPFVDADEVVDALGRWAVEEGEPDLGVFATANFNGRSPEAIAQLVLSGTRVDTGFDVIAYLFPNTRGARHDAEDERPRPRLGPAGSTAGVPGARTAAAASALATPAAPRDATTAPTSAPATAPAGAAPTQPRAHPRDIARALVSVMMADGQVRPAERRFLDAALARMGAPPLDEADLRVWRPFELGPVPDPKGLLKTMRLLALVDNEADGSERRVLQEYARAWGVALPDEPLPPTGAMAELGRSLRGLLWR